MKRIAQVFGSFGKNASSVAAPNTSMVITKQSVIVDNSNIVTTIDDHSTSNASVAASNTTSDIGHTIAHFDDDSSSLPLSVNLNGNKLVFQDNKWVFETSVFDTIADDVEELMSSRNQLDKELHEAKFKIGLLQDEVIEVNDFKTATLSMLMEERYKSLHLQHQLEEYKREVEESHRMIDELRQMLLSSAEAITTTSSSS